MRKLYEIFKLLWIQKRIVAAATIWGNTVYEIFNLLWIQKRIVATATIWGNTVTKIGMYFRMQLQKFFESIVNHFPRGKLGKIEATRIATNCYWPLSLQPDLPNFVQKLSFQLKSNFSA